MIPRLLVGFLLGATAAVFAFALLRPSGAAAPAGMAATAGTRHAGATSAADETASLLAEIAALEATGKRLRDQAAPPAGPAPVAAPAKNAAGRRIALATQIARILTSIGDGTMLHTPDGQLLSVEFQRWIASLCEETGLTPGEATFSPQGLWSFVLEALAAADPPITGEERGRFEAEFARARASWATYLEARPNLSPMERGRETSDLLSGFYHAIGEAFPGENEQRACNTFENFDIAWPGSDGGQWFGGTQGDVRSQLIRAWSSDLALDAGQAAVMGPIVDDYMVRYQSGMTALYGAGGSESDDTHAGSHLQFNLMIAMQKKVAAELELTPEQATRLKNWASVYAFRIEK